MTTFYSFKPNPNQAPLFTPTLDGSQYNVTIIWNFSAKRYYVQCVDLTGNLIFNVPLLSSPVSNQITEISYDINRLRVFVIVQNALNMPPGKVFNVTINNNSPTGYNGSGLAVVCTNYSFVYPLKIDPGPVTFFGNVDILNSICKGYFNSTLVFRNNQFEVNP